MPLKAMINPRSSVKPAILINASSKDVSLRSAAATLSRVPPFVNG